MADNASLIKKVKVVINYRDLQLQRKVFKGEIIEVSQERAKELINLGLVLEVKALKKTTSKTK